MSRSIGALFVALLLMPVAQAAVETAYVRAQPAVPLFSTPSADAVVIRQLTPGDALVVLARQPGFVNVQLADGVQGWVRDTDQTASAPGGARVAALEEETVRLGADLATARSELATAQARLRQAQQATASARDSGADQAAALQAERDRLQEQLAAAETSLGRLRNRVAELEMAQQMNQDAARLLASRQPEEAGGSAARFAARDIAVAAILAVGIALLGAWFGMLNARRRLSRRYHGLEL